MPSEPKKTNLYKIVNKFDQSLDKANLTKKQALSRATRKGSQWIVKRQDSNDPATKFYNVGKQMASLTPITVKQQREATKVTNKKTGKVMKIFKDYEDAEAYYFKLNKPENHILTNSTGTYSPTIPWYSEKKRTTPKLGPMTKQNTQRMNSALWGRSNKQLYSLLKTNKNTRARRLIYYILSTRRGGK
jgi:hypothetical protein